MKIVPKGKRIRINIKYKFDFVYRSVELISNISFSSNTYVMEIKDQKISFIASIGVWNSSPWDNEQCNAGD
jgi:hypothetical protein